MENIQQNSASIKNWSMDERPRERLVSNGAASLSNSELLAIIINNGQKERSALQIAKDILKSSYDNLNELGKKSLKELQNIKGIGQAKAITIAATLELGRRRQSSIILNKTVVRNSKEI